MIRTTSNTCTVPSWTSLEHLLLQSAAALCDVTVEFALGDKVGLETVVKDAWSTTTTHTTATGWLGALRALLTAGAGAAAAAGTYQLDPVAESWLEACDSTLVTIVRKGQKDDVLAAAALDMITKMEQHLVDKDQHFLTGDTATVADAVVAQALAAALEVLQVQVENVPLAVNTWLTTTLKKLQNLLPYLVIPKWREFALQRCNCWNKWNLMYEAQAKQEKEQTAAAKALTTTTTTASSTASNTATTPATMDPNNAITNKLQQLGIAFELYEHAKCETAEDLLTNVPLPANESHTKNLFLRDKKHGHFLVTVDPTAAVNTKELGNKLGLKGKVNLRLADKAILDAKLHVQPGCVGPLGMCLAEPDNDEKERVTFVLDAKLYAYDKIHSHPLRNDQSVKVTPVAMQEYFKKLGVEPVLLEFPAQGDKPPADSAKPAAEPAKKTDGPKKASTAGAVVKKDAGKKGETKLALQFKKNENFAQWYADVIVLSEMISYYDISGCYILRPWSYKMWELIQEWFNPQIQALGVENSYFPLFVSQDRLEKEKDHVEGFAPEVAWVTKSGESDLARPIAIRPTSETIMYPAFADWIQSHRDLPLKLNQWSNVVRWEFKYPTPFLRTREFLWQEGHTAHSTFEEADRMVMDALDLYRRVYEELMAVPVVPGFKTEAEKFAGGYRTTTVEAYVAGSGRAIQGATSHHLGQNFGKMFGITFQNTEGKSDTVWQTSWGLTTRTIGVMIMVHGDDTGLVLPPRVSPLQVVIVPIISKKLSSEQADPYCEAILKDLLANGIRAKYDERTIYTPGWKYNHWEQKGVPIRIEVGPRDLENNCARVVVRYNGEKYDLDVTGMGAALVAKLEEIQSSMFIKAKEARDNHVVKVTEWKDFVPNLEKNNLVLTPWCGGEHQDWEDHVKEKSREESLKARGEDAEDEKTSTSVAAKTLCIPFDQPNLPAGTKCLVSGMDATCWVLWGRSY